MAPDAPRVAEAPPPPTGHAGVVHTSLLLPTFNSELQLRTTKTDQQKSVGVISNKELHWLIKSYMKALKLLSCEAPVTSSCPFH